MENPHSIQPADPSSLDPPVSVLSLKTEKAEGRVPFYQDREYFLIANTLPWLRAILVNQQDIRGQEKYSGEDIIAQLSESIVALQEQFMDSLYERLKEQSVDTTHKITLRLNDTAQLGFVGEHPNAERIEGLLTEQKDLTLLFMEIALQSMFLKSLRTMYTIATYDEPADSYSVLATGVGEQIYQMTLKGDMNHFYFAR